MKALLLRSIFATLLLGPAVGFIDVLTSVKGGTKYDPPITQAEIEQMRNKSVKEVELYFSGRRMRQTRWEWLMDSIHYSYFWRQVASSSIAPSFGIFGACIWIGWTERRSSP
jgi:hypothetical protein